MPNYHWGIVGLGEIAHQMAESFAQPNSTLSAVTSRNIVKAQSFAEKYSIPNYYDSFESMLLNQQLDIIYISVPNKQHIDYILKALHAGKHVLCEKAITMNRQELQEAIILAEKKGLILAEAMTIFTMPLYHELTKIIDSGTLGKLKMIQAPFGSYKEPDPTNRFFNPDLAGGALLDIGTYAISFARWFLTAQPEVIATTMLPFSTGVDEQSMILLRNKQDEMATITLSFQAKMPKQGIVSFEKGYITIDNYPRANQAKIIFNDGTIENILSGDSQQALNYELNNIIQMIEGKQTNYSLFLTTDVIDLLDTIQKKWQSTESNNVF